MIPKADESDISAESASGFVVLLPRQLVQE
jgi:hypothetical protein